MKRKRTWRTTFGLSVILLTASPVLLRAELVLEGSHISVNGTSSSYNQFDTSAGGALSGDMENSGDLYVQNDVEIAGTLYLPAALVMQRDASAPSGDQTIYFADDGSIIDEYFFWNDSEDLFSLSNDLALIGHRTLESTRDLYLYARDPRIRFMADSDNSTPLSLQAHVFIWSNDTADSENRVMQLQNRDDDPAVHLFVGGEVVPNHSFDLAESFWKSEPLEAGELVSIDPHRSDAVRRSSGAYDRLVLGVVSTRPAIVMGGFAFSAEDLRRTWGDDVADALEGERPTLEAAVYESSEGLRAERDHLYSEATYGQHLAMLSAEHLPEPAPTDPSGDGSAVTLGGAALSEREVADSYQRALLEHEATIDDLVMQRFFDERFAEVSLAPRTDRRHRPRSLARRSRPGHGPHRSRLVPGRCGRRAGGAAWEYSARERRAPVEARHGALDRPRPDRGQVASRVGPPATLQSLLPSPLEETPRRSRASQARQELARTTRSIEAYRYRYAATPP